MSACPACGASGGRAFYERDGVPMNSMLLLDDPEEARRFPVGTLRLAHCGDCGFVWNAAFDPGSSEYSARYEASQAYSSRFTAFARELAEDWVERHAIRGKSVLEIGGEKGDFLQLMCAAGGNDGIVVDPAAVPGRLEGPGADRVRFVADFYSEAYGDLPADAVVCRHTLEHIPHVAGLMRTVRRAIGDRTNTVVLFELPDVVRVLEELAFWDLYYEHCSYFSLGSLARLFRATGFEVLRLETHFAGQYLTIEARPSEVPAVAAPLPEEDDLDRVAAAVARFEVGIGPRLDALRAQVSDLARAGRRAVVWGGGSKGVSYLTTLGLGDEVACVVDINPHKQGRYVAGTGHPVVAPGALVDVRPDLVIVMNPVYEDEVRTQLAGLGLSPEVAALSKDAHPTPLA